MDLLGGNMILVTLGTQDKDFSRLLKVVEQAVSLGTIQEKVVVQAGYTKFVSKHMEIFDFVGRDQMEKWVEECDLLITHGGVGSIVSGLQHHKKVIAAARLKKYGEHTNDHQKQIIKQFVQDGLLTELSHFDKLSEAIISAKALKAKNYTSNTNSMIHLIEEYINSH